jgi:drug/metabolite transporter (DMT)-like permease
MDIRIGEIAALTTAVFWTITAVTFEYAARRIGSLALNILRLAAALLMFAVLGLILRGEPIPVSAGSYVWFWLSLSGLVGFVFGDIFLFQAYIDIGARTTQVLFASAPLMTAIIGFFALGERISLLGVAGMASVISGIALVILDKKPYKARTTVAAVDTQSPKDTQFPTGTLSSALPGSHRLRGILCAIGGALGQAGGLVLSKIGAPDYDPFAATQIRVIAGLAGFLVMAAMLRRFREPWKALSDKKALGSLTLGSVFGPFLGVSLGMFAVQRSNAGIAATLMGLTPIIILIPAIFWKKERVTLREGLGALIAVAGSALLFSA